jgi:hypothetical protein
MPVPIYYRIKQAFKAVDFHLKHHGHKIAQFTLWESLNLGFGDTFYGWNSIAAQMQSVSA